MNRTKCSPRRSLGSKTRDACACAARTIGTCGRREDVCPAALGTTSLGQEGLWVELPRERVLALRTPRDFAISSVYLWLYDQHPGQCLGGCSRNIS